jgi:multidrug efflux system membrane fusion protein
MNRELLRARKWSLTLVAGVALTMMIGWHWYHRPVTAATTPSDGQGQGVPVTAGTAGSGDVPIYLTGLGSAQGFNTVTVRPRVDGQLIKVTFKEGQNVKTGDVLAQIDARPFQAQVDQARAAKAKDEAQLANAKLDLKRFTDLASHQFASKQSVDAQKAQVEQLEAAVSGDQAALDNATVQLGYTTITAPIDGRTGIRQVDVGNIVHASDTTGLVVIAQVHPISVVFTMPQDVLDQIVHGMAKGPLKVEAFARDDTTEEGKGTLALVDNQIDPTTGTIKLKANFPNDNDQLWPGEFVNIHLLVDIRHDAVTVPAQVVQRGPNGTFAYVIKDDQTVEARPVKLGQVRDGVAVIDQGLSAGERVVVDGQYKVQPGTRVDARAESKPVASQG